MVCGRRRELRRRFVARHAAMEPRFRGGVVILARSFARIHEANLKKQGILPLTFTDPATYDAHRRGRPHLRARTGRPGARPAGTLPHHQARRHPRSTSSPPDVQPRQIEWFRAGSALNIIRAKQTEDHRRRTDRAAPASCEDFRNDSLGDDGDPIPILPHSLHARRGSEVAPDDDELIVAGLVHDIGHRLQPGSRSSTERSRPTRCATCSVGGSPRSSRCTCRPSAISSPSTTATPALSTGSTASLARQGGMLDPAEQAALERAPRARRRVDAAPG